MIEHTRACYCASIAEFMATEQQSWLDVMTKTFCDKHKGMDLNELQKEAGKDSYDVLKVAFAKKPILVNSYIIFEYALPYEGGRRPDVILINSDTVAILEFKMKKKVKRADIDQLKAYARDISEYHVASRERKIVPVLLLTKGKDISKEKEGVWIKSPDRLVFTMQDKGPVDIEGWLSSSYQPLPSVVSAAKMFAAKESLPQIRQARSAGIDEAITCLN